LPITWLPDIENTLDDDPVTFQYSNDVVRISRPPCISHSTCGQKKNHCSLSLTFTAPTIAPFIIISQFIKYKLNIREMDWSIEFVTLEVTRVVAIDVDDGDEVLDVGQRAGEPVAKVEVQ
jgi:hypothetical protein